MAGVTSLFAGFLAVAVNDFEVLGTRFFADAFADVVPDFAGVALRFDADFAELRVASLEVPFAPAFIGADLDDDFVVRAGMDGSCGPV